MIHARNGFHFINNTSIKHFYSKISNVRLRRPEPDTCSVTLDKVPHGKQIRGNETLSSSDGHVKLVFCFLTHERAAVYYAM